MIVQTKFKVSAPPFRRDEAGGIRIGQSRVTLDSVLAAYHQGAIPEEIAIQFSVLSLEEIYSTISYYLNYRQEIDNYLEQLVHCYSIPRGGDLSSTRISKHATKNEKR